MTMTATQPTYEDLIVERDGAITTITLDRPDRMNAISRPMLQGFSQALIEADRDPEVRVIIVTGAGRGFCAGLDLKDFSSGGIGSTTGNAKFDLRDAPPVVLHQTDTPVICALNGAAAGYGMDLALGCDIRIASDQGKLAAVAVRRNVLPESGGTWLLPRLVGWAKAAEVAFRGRVIGADEALQLGLVNHVVPHADLMSTAREWAGEIASCAPAAVQATKRMMRMGMNETFEANVHHVYLQLLPLFRSDDFREGVAAFTERREPVFKGR